MSLSAAALIGVIQRNALRVFTTADILTLTGLAPSAATQALSRLAGEGLVARLKRGVWVNRLAADVDPYEAVPYLRPPWPAYVSLHSALADHGIIEEVPHVVYAVSAALPKRYRTPVGGFHFHHLPERLMTGFEMRRRGRASFPMADAEKALLDLVYLALTPRCPLELPVKRAKRWGLDPAKLKRYEDLYAYPPLSAWLKANIPP